MFNFFEWIKQSSTIRGIIALATVLGYGGAKWADATTLQAIILALGPLFYAIYNMFRKDSNGTGNGTAAGIAIVLLLFPIGVQAASINLAPMAGVTEYTAEVDGNIQAPPFVTNGDGSASYNLEPLGLPDGVHVFRFMVTGTDNGVPTWGGGWSAPFEAEKVGVPTVTGLSN